MRFLPGQAKPLDHKRPLAPSTDHEYNQGANYGNEYSKKEHRPWPQRHNPLLFLNHIPKGRFGYASERGCPSKMHACQGN